MLLQLMSIFKSVDLYGMSYFFLTLKYYDYDLNKQS